MNIQETNGVGELLDTTQKIYGILANYDVEYDGSTGAKVLFSSLSILYTYVAEATGIGLVVHATYNPSSDSEGDKKVKTELDKLNRLSVDFLSTSVKSREMIGIALLVSSDPNKHLQRATTLLKSGVGIVGDIMLSVAAPEPVRQQYRKDGLNDDVTSMLAELEKLLG